MRSVFLLIYSSDAPCAGRREWVRKQFHKFPGEKEAFFQGLTAKLILVSQDSWGQYKEPPSRRAGSTQHHTPVPAALNSINLGRLASSSRSSRAERRARLVVRARMPGGASLLNSGGGMADCGGGLTVPVVVTCLMAASGGLIFGYDIGISGKPPLTLCLLCRCSFWGAFAVLLD
jgi:hypothetical protein